MGGEKNLSGSAIWENRGSPPRGRGKASHCFHTLSIAGITPAWAGKSPVWHPCSGRCGDHPRVGGEKYNSAEALANRQGSPPRGRGKASHCFHTLSIAGITPAWAGKSRAALSPKNCSRDHPRVGGEKPAVAAHVRAQLGSPPRGRGKGMELPPPVARHGITPAWAGKRKRTGGKAGGREDHPRVGGEKH